MGDVTETSYITATCDMLFSFLTCEMKSEFESLDVGDRQNTHSMTIVVGAVEKLFRLVGRENEINREILSFSFSHNNTIVRIYGHYAVFSGPKTRYYRHPIRDFNLEFQDGRERWTAYRFTKNIYDIWVATALEKDPLCCR